MGEKCRLDQTRAPLFEALKSHIERKTVAFHVPGHKAGRGICDEFKSYLGKRLFQMDLNGMEDLDSICNPIGVIKEAEDLMAELFHGDDSFFLVNGTSQGVQAMILYACRPGEKIILPKNVHKSALAALIISGGIPIYLQPKIHKELGISMGVEVEDIKSAIMTHPDAKAIFINNPTYYGIASDLAQIANLAHKNNMLLLADEAHGAHFPFSPLLPPSAMSCGADLSAVSLHKTGGSMTQSSVLFVKNKNINPSRLRTLINLLQTTSASYILMASLDMARKYLAARGKSMVANALCFSKYCRREINKIPGLYAFGPDLVGTPGVFSFDETKLCINTRSLGISGYSLEAILRDRYNIQMEMSDFHNSLAIISIGDDLNSLEQLIASLKDIAKKEAREVDPSPVIIPPLLETVMIPRDAFYASQRSLPLENTIGEISGEMVMAYPPGIPALNLGERITKEAVEYIKMMKASGYQLQGTEDPKLNYLKVVKK